MAGTLKQMLLLIKHTDPQWTRLRLGVFTNLMPSQLAHHVSLLPQIVMSLGALLGPKADSSVK